MKPRKLKKALRRWMDTGALGRRGRRRVIRWFNLNRAHAGMPPLPRRPTLLDLP